MILDRAAAFFFLATLFSVTFEKVHWEVAGSVSLADVLALLFVLTFIATRWLEHDRRLTRTALVALAKSGLDVDARFVGDFRSADRGWARERGLDDRMTFVPYAPRREALRLQRDSEALLLLIPEAAGRGKGVLSGKVFEYLAAERPILALVPPDGAAAELIRETGAGVVVAPEDVDGIASALAGLEADWREGRLILVALAVQRKDFPHNRVPRRRPRPTHRH